MAQPTYEQLLDLIAERDRRIVELGAQAQAVLMSVLRTCAQQHRDALALVSLLPAGQAGLPRGQWPRLLLAPR